ncbi:hypothetical protein JTB14_002857 [Gonioctena quinquepunctata]|nr:hypothetical protein JTB14_002857 [Gonioctena quinquepunctata]
MIGSENEEEIRIIESSNDNRQEEEAVQTEIQVSDDNEEESQDENIQSISKTEDLSSRRSERLPKPRKWSSDMYLYHIEYTNLDEPKSVEEALSNPENNKCAFRTKGCEGTIVTGAVGDGFWKTQIQNHYQQQGENLNIQQQERIRGPLTTIRRTVHPKIGLGLRKKKKQGENLDIQQQERIRGPLTTIRRPASPRFV